MAKGRYSIKMLLATIIAGVIYSVIAEIFLPGGRECHARTGINTALFYRSVSGVGRHGTFDGQNDLQKICRNC